MLIPAPIERLAVRLVTMAMLSGVSAAACLPVGTARDLVRILAVHLSSGSQRIRVAVELNGPIRYQAGRLKDTKRLYLDFRGATLDSGFLEREIEVGDATLTRIRIGELDGSCTRIVFDLGRDVQYTIQTFTGPPRVVIDLNPSGKPTIIASETDGSQSDSRELPTELAANEAGSGQVPQQGPTTRPPDPRPPIEQKTPRISPATEAARVTEAVTTIEGTRRLRIPRVSRAPRLEDFINGNPRESETMITTFRQRSPGDGTPISRDTSAYLSYDEKNLYVIFVCKEKHEAVRAHLAKREDIDLDDSVSIYLDTFRDRRRAYVFSVNPLGIQRDGMITEGQGDPDYSFDTLWSSQGRLTPDGFVVWLAIPFKSLRFPSGAAQTWGIALGRSIVHSGEDSYWPYITNRVEGFVPQMGVLEGLEQISTERGFQFIPYGTVTRSRSLDPSVPGFRTTDQGRGGLDAKFVLNKAFTFDLTLNPDFSEVESDDPQVLVNQRFEVFFPEKRQFFIENAGIFQTPEPLFYSRRIQDPEFGARLTGKTGSWAVGILAADDRAPGQQLAAADPGSGDRAVLGVVRVQRELGNESTIGILATTRGFGSSVNDVLSMDMRLKLSPTWVFTAQAIRSFDRSPGGSRVQGSDYLASLSHNSRHLTYSLSYLDRSPTFDAPLGFIQRVDIRQASQSIGYYWRPGRGPVVAYGPSLTASIDWNHKGRLQDWSGTADFALFFRRASELKITSAEYYELFQLQHLRQHSTSVSFYSNPARWSGVSGSYQQGAVANYFPPVTLMPFVAKGREAAFGFNLRPSSRLRFDESYMYTGLAARRELSSALAQAPAILNNHISRTKVNYQLTRALSLRAILDYNAVLPNSLLIARQRTKRIAPDVLLTYLLNPGTAVYIGYHDQYDNLQLEPGPPRILMPSDFPGLLTGRQFFVKLTYAFRY